MSERFVRTMSGFAAAALWVILCQTVGSAVAAGITDNSDSCRNQEQVYQQVPPIERTSLSPDATRLAVVTADGSVWIVEGRNFGNTRRLTNPIKSLGTVQWSPDGRWLLVEGERDSDNTPGYPWGSLWLVDPERKSPQKDLLPMGSPFRTPGRRWIQEASWLDNDRVYFSMHCGSGCVGHYSVNIKDLTYSIFCIGSGQFVWAPNRKIAVAENYGGGSGPIGLGVVDEASAIKMAAGATTPMQPRLCKSVFSGGPRIDDPGEVPRMVTWFPDNRHVLYVNLQDGSARSWDTSTGQRTTLIGGQNVGNGGRTP